MDGLLIALVVAAVLIGGVGVGSTGPPGQGPRRECSIRLGRRN